MERMEEMEGLWRVRTERLSCEFVRWGGGSGGWSWVGGGASE